MVIKNSIFKTLDNAPMLNILVLGASGMLGSALFHQLPKISSNYNVLGTFRSGAKIPNETKNAKLVRLDDVFNANALRKIVKENEIHVIINGIGLIKQISSQLKRADFIKVNAWLPHYLMELCDEINARFIEISTDCVFTGKKGNYNEADVSDAMDMYGITKFLGEVIDNPKAVTLRTSIIGHESGRAASLIDWFLSTSDQIEGYKKAIFSGFPTVYLAQIIGFHVLTNDKLSGLYHVSANPIDKFTLLSLVGKAYNHPVKITPNTNIAIDRSLDSSKFRKATGFSPPDWQDLINAMKNNRPKWT